MKKTLSISILAASLCACVDTTQLPDEQTSQPSPTPGIPDDTGGAPVDPAPIPDPIPDPDPDPDPDPTPDPVVDLVLEQVGGSISPGGTVQLLLKNNGDLAWDSPAEMASQDSIVIKNLDSNTFVTTGFSLVNSGNECTAQSELQASSDCALSILLDDTFATGRYEIAVARYVTDTVQEPVGNAPEIPRLTFLVASSDQGSNQPFALISSDTNTDFPAVKSIKVVNPDPIADVTLSAQLSALGDIEIFSQAPTQHWGRGLSDSCYSQSVPFSQSVFTVNANTADQINYCYIYFRVMEFRGGEVGAADPVSAVLTVSQPSADQVLGNFNIIAAPVLYAAGDFSDAMLPEDEFLTEYGGLVRWDGNSLSRVGELDEAYGTDNIGFNGTIYDLRTNTKGEIYVGGWFETWNGMVDDLNGLAKWNGRNWSSVGGGVDDWIWGIAVDYDDNVYITGSFTQTNTASNSPNDIASVAKWDGDSWLPMREPADQSIGAGDPVIGPADEGIRYYMRGIHWNPVSDTVTVDAFVGFRINIDQSEIGFIHQWNNQGPEASNWNNMSGGPGTKTVLGIQPGNYGDKLAYSFQDKRTNDLYAAFWISEGDSSIQGRNVLAKWNGSEWTFVDDGEYPYYAQSAGIVMTQPTEDGSFYVSGGAGGEGFQLAQFDAVQGEWSDVGQSFYTAGYGISYAPTLTVDDNNTLYAAVTTAFRHTSGASDAVYRYDEDTDTFEMIFDVLGWASVSSLVVSNEVKVELIQD